MVAGAAVTIGTPEASATFTACLLARDCSVPFAAKASWAAIIPATASSYTALAMSSAASAAVAAASASAQAWDDGSVQAASRLAAAAVNAAWAASRFVRAVLALPSAAESSAWRTLRAAAISKVFAAICSGVSTVLIAVISWSYIALSPCLSAKSF